MHLVSPRTLLFLDRDDRWLFLRGAPGKWFAGRLNGLGGHVEPGEDVRSAAQRECAEETGLVPVGLELAAIAHVAVPDPGPAVLLFVFTGHLPAGDLRPTREGEHVWHDPRDVPRSDQPFVDDLRVLVPALVGRAPGAAPLWIAL